MRRDGARSIGGAIHSHKAIDVNGILDELRHRADSACIALTPVGQQVEQITRAYDTVLVKVGRTIITVTAWSPLAQEDQEVASADVAVLVEIAHARLDWRE